jgi:hypothetical protein
VNDNYQATFDAVRSCLRNTDVGAAIRDACHLDASHAIVCLQQEFSLAAYEMARPSAVYRPTIARDGNKWCALYGSNLMEGIAGFGDTPNAAMADFDKNWWNEKPPQPHEHEYTGQQEMKNATCIHCGFKPWSVHLEPPPPDAPRS